jgi:AraC-like DNA-binding protein
MVCNRCIKVVGEELRALGLDVRSVTLGEVVVGGEVKGTVLRQVVGALERNGFELIEDRDARTIERIKLAILKLVRGSGPDSGVGGRLSEVIPREVGGEYRGLSALFSSRESITIEQYAILQRIERVKELLKYGETTLSEIAYALGYSSVQHLSTQFKKVTGLTPSDFKKMTADGRTPLDRVGRRAR